MTQRLGLARVLLHDPQVLLLDEPASGLDPRVRIEIRRVIRHLGEAGKTVMVSSHILPELADMCNKIGMIEKGVLEVNGTARSRQQPVVRRHVLRIVASPAITVARTSCWNGIRRAKIEPVDGVLR